MNGINPALIEPGVEYKLYTDASGNIYIEYVDTEGRPYTILADGKKKYLEAPPIQTYGFVVFQDQNCDKFVIDADGSRNYLKIDSTALQGPNFITHVDQNGKLYRIYTDPTGNQYTINQKGAKSYITGFPNVPGTDYKVYTDVLGSEFTVYNQPNGDTYTVNQFNRGSKFYWDINCKQVPVQGLPSPGQGAIQQPAFNLFGLPLYDDSGNRFALNPDKSWNYLFLAPGSSNNNNPAVFRDSNAGNYMIFSEPNNGTKYVKNTDGTKTYLNSFPATTAGVPITFDDAYGNVYTVYSDPAGNRYVTYSDSRGRYYINDNGSKTYLPQNIPTTSVPQTTAPTVPSNTGSFVSPGTNTGSFTSPGTTTLPSTGGLGGAPVYIFTDSTGGNRYILNSNNNRVYLTLNSTSGTSQTFTDPQGNRYTISRDPTTSNAVTTLGSNVRQFVTGYPTSTVGSPISLSDTLGTRYSIVSDNTGNRYVTYTDPVGTYYLNANGVKVYLPQQSPRLAGLNGYIFTDSTGGNRYLINPDGTRSYLTLTSSAANTQIYTDPRTGSRYTVTKDPTTDNSLTVLPGNVR